MFKALNIWLPGYLRSPRHSRLPTTHLLFCVCDHFEPFHDATKAEAVERVSRWELEFPGLSTQFHDSDGLPPCQTFFYPVEQYDHDVLAPLGRLCAATRCETEIHLHHKDDTAENLAATLEQGKRNLTGHGLLSTDPSGAVRFGFIHGNWALDNSRPGGGNCGVRNELRVLQEAGCYADFTMPSAPDPCQTSTVNSIYYATPSDKPKSHDHGRPSRVGVPDGGDFLLVQGPLGLNWHWRKWGLLPRVENADITPRNPPTEGRLRLWMELSPRVEGRPEWIFVKLHAHGGIPRNMDMLLGGKMQEFHRTLSNLADSDPGFHFHYVTARELVNIVHAAEAGKEGNPAEYRDFRYTRLPRAK